MKNLIIFNYGVKKDVQTIRVNGDKDSLYKYINECKKLGNHFDDIPHLNKINKNQWTLILKLKDGGPQY